MLRARVPQAVLLLVASSLACAPIRPPTSAPGAGWYQVLSEHFEVVDFGPNAGAALEITSELELLFDALIEVPLLGNQGPGHRTLVVVFDDKRSYQAIGGKSEGLFWPRTALGDVLLVPPHRPPLRSETLRHELAHVLLEASVPGAPRWLHEGLASVLQTARYDAATRKVYFGEPSPLILSWTRRAHDTGVETLLAARSASDSTSFYGASWLLTHFLIDHHPESFGEFVRLLAKGLDPRTAWRLAGLPPPSALDAALGRYSRSARLGVWSVPARRPTPSQLRARALTSNDVGALRAGLLVHSKYLEDSKRARLDHAEAEIDAVLAKAPAHRRAQGVKAYILRARAGAK